MNEPSLKRLAWRFGCAASGSLEEKRAQRALIKRILRDHNDALGNLSEKLIKAGRAVGEAGQ